MNFKCNKKGKFNFGFDFNQINPYFFVELTKIKAFLIFSLTI